MSEGLVTTAQQYADPLPNCPRCPTCPKEARVLPNGHHDTNGGGTQDDGTQGHHDTNGAND